MSKLTGTVGQIGSGDMGRRMRMYPGVFAKAIGEPLRPGTINVRVTKKVPILEKFRISGADIGEPHQDLLLEPCLIDGIRAYRIRPYVLTDGTGGWGDDVLEITSPHEVPDIAPGKEVVLDFFRDEV